MRRITISVDDDLASAFDALVLRKGYGNRSEAFRDLVRGALGNASLGSNPEAPYVATVSYLFDHNLRRLPTRLAQMQHQHVDVTFASQHVHLNKDDCLETVVLRGSYAQVLAVADSMTSQTGIRHGNIHLVPLDSSPPHKHP